jgi:hypothetical protein
LPHDALEEKLGHYCGLVLYVKEMDEERYQKLCAVGMLRGLGHSHYTDDDSRNLHIELLQRRE